MKFLKILCFLLCLTHTASLWAATSVACSKEDIQKFKEEYVKLQNALNYEGKNIELKKTGKVAAVGSAVESDNSPGKKAQEVLFKNYQNALIKVEKIYQQLNGKGASDSDKKLMESNPDVVNFFKAINTKSDQAPAKLNINIDTLLSKLQKVQIKGFELKNEDIYLLKDLLIHSQDRICTLAQYVQSKKANPNSTRTQYLEQLKDQPLNKMIESLREMSGSDSLSLANEGTTLDEAVENSINNLRAIIKAHKGCEKTLATLSLGEPIQGCNYAKFIKSLSANDDQFDKFESVLHFINANENAKDARTSLDWINSQFKDMKQPKCYVDPESKSIYVKNMPFSKDQTNIDSAKVSCEGPDGKKLAAAICAKSLSVQFEQGRGMHLTAKKDAKVNKVSIADSTTCLNMSLAAPVPLVGNAVKPNNDAPVVSSDPKKCDEAGCKKQVMTGATFFWKKDLNYCAYTLANSKDEHWQCSLDGKEPAAPAVDDHKCTDDKSCKEKNKDAAWDATLSSCYTQPKEGDKVFVCNADGAEKKAEAKPDNKCTDKQKLVDGKCQETAESCKAKAKKDEYLKPSEDGLSCVAVSGSELCDLKNKDWAASKKKDGDDDGVSWSTRYRWNSETKKCDDKEKKKESKEDDTPSDDTQTPQYAPKQAPGRFQPINIPTRQMYILPGMP